MELTRLGIGKMVRLTFIALTVSEVTFTKGGGAPSSRPHTHTDRGLFHASINNSVYLNQKPRKSTVSTGVTDLRHRVGSDGSRRPCLNKLPGSHDNAPVAARQDDLAGEQLASPPCHTRHSRSSKHHAPPADSQSLGTKRKRRAHLPTQYCPENFTLSNITQYAHELSETMATKNCLDSASEKHFARVNSYLLRASSTNSPRSIAGRIMRLLCRLVKRNGVCSKRPLAARNAPSPTEMTLAEQHFLRNWPAPFEITNRDELEMIHY